MTAEISRRLTLSWIASASLGAYALAGCETALAQPTTGLWKDLVLEPITAPGYGQDPDLNKATVTWPLTLSKAQRDVLRIAADIILPADAHSPSGSALHIDAFVDEWVSAPYPVQGIDRGLIVSGLAWLDAESQQRFSLDFAHASDAQRRMIFDRIAFKKKIQPGYERPAQFFARLRGLMLAAFYSLPEGMADIGYLGNNPILGRYPGPTKEALVNLNASLTKLGLKTLKV